RPRHQYARNRFEKYLRPRGGNRHDGTPVITVGEEIPADSTFCIPVSQVPSFATGLLLKVTAPDSGGARFVQLATTGMPGATSNLNKAAGLTLSNQTSLQLGQGGSFEPGTPFTFAVMIINQGSAGRLVIDLVGYYIANT